MPVNSLHPSDMLSGETLHDSHMKFNTYKLLLKLWQLRCPMKMQNQWPMQFGTLNLQDVYG